MAARNPSDINKKLAGLTRAQANELAAHLNDAYTGKKSKQNDQASAKKSTNKQTKK